MTDGPSTKEVNYCTQIGVDDSGKVKVDEIEVEVNEVESQWKIAKFKSYDFYKF